MYNRPRGASIVSLESETDLCRTGFTVEVTVRFFGPAAEAAGCCDLRLSLPDGAVVEDAVAEARRRVGAIRGPLRFAVGTEYAESDRALRHGDEISIIPPVGGG
jgi:molybdopterin converting factor small subunit